MKKFYVTTPIYYVTAKPHLGSLYSTLLADVAARFERLKGNQSFFLTGTDEHGQKVSDAAVISGKKTQQFLDSLIPAYKNTWRLFDILYNRFIRTTEEKHKIGAQALVKKLITTGDIYKGTYEGWYCTPCETFVAEKELIDQMPLCTSCGENTTIVKEETYFFKLSAYQEKLLTFYRNTPDFITPKERSAEVINFVKNGLRDLSISRTSVSWGVPFPDDTKHTIYVWIEALCNYLTAVGYGDKELQNLFYETWPADVHVLGKDIIRFHAIYWPALLMAAELALPKKLLVHGWITVNKKKMSKSLGNAIDPVLLSEQYGADEIRFYLLRHLPVTHDGDFNIEDLEQCITADLANTLGNLFNRTAILARANGLSVINTQSSDWCWSSEAKNIHKASITMMCEYKEHMQSYYIHLALNSVWHFLHLVNAYFHSKEPWKLVKHDRDAFIEVINTVCHSLYTVALFLLPIMPQKMKALLRAIGHEYNDLTDTLETIKPEIWNKPFELEVIPPLFVKPEQRKSVPAQNVFSDKEKEKTMASEPLITIDDIVKTMLLVGTIKSAVPVEKSEKLMILHVNFGTYGERQIIAGIKQYYHNKDLIGRQALFVYNLKPRTMVGLESHGMMMMAKDANNIPQIVRPANIVPDGTRLS